MLNIAELEDRRNVVANAIASQQLSRLQLDKDSLVDYCDFIDGQISLEEVRSRIEMRFIAKT